jgi:protein-S-isoprenylcysteine O-methyltransferase Ste14
MRETGGVSLALRNLFFTIVMPGTAAVYVPWLILDGSGAEPAPMAWPAIVLIALGAALYAWCVWAFATVGRGTPAPWDAPRRFVAVGPYRWVRNPMYIAVLVVVIGVAWLFLSLPLLAWAGVLALAFHLFVVAYEEPTLTRTFGETYIAYRRAVRRWLPMPPRSTEAIR